MCRDGPRVWSLETELDVNELIDRAEIADVLARYVRGADRRDRRSLGAGRAR